MANMKTATPPTGLGPRGRTLWRSVTSDYTLTHTELELLRVLCSATDQLGRIELRLKAEHVTSTGSQGQLRAHPLLAEFRLHSDMVRQLSKQLNLPDLDKAPRKPKMGARVGQMKSVKAGV
jgi:hypothetical protein